MNSPGYLRWPQLNAAITDETDPGAPAPCHGFPYVSVYITGTGTTSSGVVTVETADYDPQSVTNGYAGTWSAVTTINASDVTGGAQKLVALTTASYAFIRTRVTTAIGGGGSISTVIVAA
jgi:hypothetical protein